MNILKWAFVGDLQIPYQDNRAVALFMKAMRLWNPDIIDFVGDIDDQLEYSRFSIGGTDEFFSELKNNEKYNLKAAEELVKTEQKQGRTLDFEEALRHIVPKQTDPLPLIKENASAAGRFYEDMRLDHPKAEMHSSLGNHDIRIFDYVDKKFPELNEFVTPNLLWGLDDLGITWRHYELPPLKRHADIHVHHGATTTDTGLAVKGDIEKYNISLVRGHDHRGGVVYKSYPMTELSLAGMGCGHLCDPQGYGLRYTINPAWEKGFGIAHLVDGKAHLQFVPIRDYKCIIDGVVVEG